MHWKAAPLSPGAARGNLAGSENLPLCLRAMRAFGPPPSLEEIEALARCALKGLPEPFASRLTGVVLQVQDFAEDGLLAEMGIEDPFELTGLYEGIPLGEQSVDQSGALPDRIFLFRRPILDEWVGSQDSLEHLVRHVLIHEAGHHFGLSDEDMHALEAQA
jgi:predicted Zn-dependent protease with MMP-like domain